MYLERNAKHPSFMLPLSNVASTLQRHCGNIAWDLSGRALHKTPCLKLCIWQNTRKEKGLCVSTDRVLARS